MSAASFRLEKGDVLIIDGVWLEILHRNAESMTLRSQGGFQTTRSYSHDELFALYFEKRLRIARQVTIPLSPAIADALERDPQSFKDQWQEEMLIRLDYVQACDRFFQRFSRRPGWGKRPDQGYARISGIVHRYLNCRAKKLGFTYLSARALEPRSGTSLRDWYRRWIQANRNMLALVPLHHRKGWYEDRLDPVVTRIIAHHIRERWLTSERPPASIIYDLILKDLTRLKNGHLSPSVPDPSRMAVYRWIDENVGEYEQVLGREGKKAADTKVAATRPRPAINIPLRVVEVDHTRLDIILVTEQGEPLGANKAKGKPAVVGRAWLTVIIDVATRMILGFNIDYLPPSWTSVMKALRMAVLPKDVSDIDAATPWPAMGVPEIVKLDNGKEFHSSSMKAAAGQLHFELRYCPKGKPHLKGRVERFFGEVARDYCALFPGRTFANVVEKADYRPEEWAIMTLEQARDLFKLWVVDIYHNKPHGGLMGKTPLRRWEELKGFGVRLPPAAEDLDALIGHVVQRQIGRQGVKYLGLTYSSKEIYALRLQPGRSRDDWTIRIDTEDLTTISVLDPEKGKLLQVPCCQANLVQNLNIHMWREVCEEARRVTPAGERVRRSALLEARQRIAEAAKKMGNKPRAKVTKHDLDWMEAHADDPEFDVSDDDAPSSATGGRRQSRKAKSSPSSGPSDTCQNISTRLRRRPAAVCLYPSAISRIIQRRAREF